MASDESRVASEYGSAPQWLVNLLTRAEDRAGALRAHLEERLARGEITCGTAEQYYALARKLFPQMEPLPRDSFLTEGAPQRELTSDLDGARLKRFLAEVRLDADYATADRTSLSLEQQHRVNCALFTQMVALTGLRLAEAKRLRLSSLAALARRDPRLPLRRKTTKHWEVVYSEALDRLVQRLQQWFSHSLARWRHERGFDFPLWTLSHSAIYHYFRSTFERANPDRLGNLPSGLGPHVLRALLATEMEAAGAPGASIARALGHASARTAKRHYIRRDAQRTSEALSRSEAPLFLKMRAAVPSYL